MLGRAVEPRYRQPGSYWLHRSAISVFYSSARIMTNTLLAAAIREHPRGLALISAVSIT